VVLTFRIAARFLNRPAAASIQASMTLTSSGCQYLKLQHMSHQYINPELIRQSGMPTIRERLSNRYPLTRTWKATTLVIKTDAPNSVHCKVTTLRNIGGRGWCNTTSQMWNSLTTTVTSIGLTAPSSEASRAMQTRVANA
jgi:hypothetical protein